MSYNVGIFIESFSVLPLNPREILSKGFNSLPCVKHEEPYNFLIQFNVSYIFNLIAFAFTVKGLVKNLFEVIKFSRGRS